VVCIASRVPPAAPGIGIPSATEALDDITHSPEVTDAVARVVRFFNSIGIG